MDIPESRTEIENLETKRLKHLINVTEVDIDVYDTEHGEHPEYRRRRAVRRAMLRELRDRTTDEEYRDFVGLDDPEDEEEEEEDEKWWGSMTEEEQLKVLKEVEREVAEEEREESEK